MTPPPPRADDAAATLPLWLEPEDLQPAGDVPVLRLVEAPPEPPRGAGLDGFTAQQRHAIEVRDRPLFLAAGAGSGKTRVLVERIVRAVAEDGVGLDAILAITFTEAAAAELRERVRGRLLELGLVERAREAEGAAVSTVHGFCWRLLRTHALEAGLDPDVHVLDDRRAEQLRRRAAADALEDLLADGDVEAVELVAAHGPDRLSATVRELFARLRSRGETRPRLPAPERPDLSEPRRRLEAALAAALAELGSGPPATATAERALARMEGCRDLLAGPSPCSDGAAAPPAAEDPVRLTALRVVRGNARALRGPVFDELELAHDAYGAACRARQAIGQAAVTDRLLQLYGMHYAEAKERASALDFEDLELRARDLLRDAPELAVALRSRLTHVLVDEFQDTNSVQAELLDLLDAGSLFTVGDEAQSIYRFRSADVEVFRRRRAAAARDGTLATLTTNFRSDPELLTTVSAAFSTALGEGHLPLDAPGDDDPGLDPAAPAEPLVELLAVDAVEERWQAALGPEGFGEGLAGVETRRAAEARWLARRVGELVETGTHRPGDVVVLLRSRAQIDVYERALAERGLPTHVDGGGGLWGRTEIADLRSYLAVLANPLDEAALLAVLASPLTGASLDAVALLGLAARRGGRRIWPLLEVTFSAGGPAVASAGEGEAGADPFPDRLEPRDREALAAFVHGVTAERRDAPRRPLEALIDRAAFGTPYEAAVLEGAGGARRRANVGKLMRLAREFEADRGRDLRGFVDALADLEALGDREPEAPADIEGLDAVRLMTAHAAKGLEFPVVCVADLGRRPRRDDASVRVAGDGRLGLRLRTLGGDALPALDLDALRVEDEAADEAEERRVVYVAATRARERLILSGATDLERLPAPSPAGAPMAWVWRAFAPDLAERRPGTATGASRREWRGRAARVAWTVLAPETLADVLPPADRVGGEPQDASRAARRRPEGLGDVENTRPHDPAATARPAGPAHTPPEAPGELSYSSLEAYRRCGYRYYLEHVLGLRPDADPSPPDDGHEGDGRRRGGGLGRRSRGGPVLSGRVRGLVAHELIERVGLARPRPPARREVAARVAAHGGQATDRELDELGALVGGLIASPLWRRVRAARRVRREVPFAFVLPRPGGERPLLIDGAMDLHAEEGSEALVVDAKTDRVAGAEEDGQARGPRVRSGAVELEAVSTQRYGLQRLVYALAALREGAAAVEVVHVFLERPGEPTSVRYVAGDRDELERRLLALAEELMEGRYVPSGAPNRVLCASCPGRAALCAWGPERTRAEPPGVGLTGGEGDPPPPPAGSAGAAEDGARRSVGTTP